MELSPDGPFQAAAPGYVYALANKKEEARAIARKLEEDSARSHVSPYLVAWVYAGLGEPDQAMRWLEKGYEEKASLMVLLRSDPLFRNLRPDTRFHSLLPRLNFPE